MIEINIFLNIFKQIIGANFLAFLKSVIPVYSFKLPNLLIIIHVINLYYEDHIPTKQKICSDFVVYLCKKASVRSGR